MALEKKADRSDVDVGAWVLSKAHIDALVTAAWDRAVAWYAEPEPAEFAPGLLKGITSEHRASEVGMMLWAQNLACVQYHCPIAALIDASYPGPKGFSAFDVARYKFERTKRLGPVAVLKALDCYEAQSDSHPLWRRSEARSFCMSLRDAVFVELPGYREFPWDIEEQDVR